MAQLLLRVLLILIAIVVVAVGGLLWMAGGIQSPRAFEAPPETVGEVGTTTSTTPEQLRVVVWNIAWGYGWGSEGTGDAKPEEHFRARLDKIAEVLRSVRADVVLLQEVDFDCGRSHGVDQARLLAEQAGLPYVAKAESWRANYLPFPYWPPKNHFGRMRSGGAILSRFPITANTVELFPKPEDNSFIYNLGYLFRFLQRTELSVGAETVTVFNAHTDAFSLANRQAHAGHIARRLEEHRQPRLLFGADLNTVPPESSTRSAYPDEPQTSHEDDATLPRLRGVDGLTDALPVDRFLEDEAAYFTFPAHAPNRKLDYLFTGDGFEVVQFRVLTEAGDVSDHLPVFGDLRLRAKPPSDAGR